VTDPIDLTGLGVDASATIAAAWTEIENIHDEVRAAGGHISEDQRGRLRAAESTIYLYGPHSPAETR
jgi:hypothetical protein